MKVTNKLQGGELFTKTLILSISGSLASITVNFLNNHLIY